MHKPFVGASLSKEVHHSIGQVHYVPAGSLDVQLDAAHHTSIPDAIPFPYPPSIVRHRAGVGFEASATAGAGEPWRVVPVAGRHRDLAEGAADAALVRYVLRYERGDVEAPATGGRCWGQGSAAGAVI
jgi:hypothetical protein